MFCQLLINYITQGIYKVLSRQAEAGLNGRSRAQKLSKDVDFEIFWSSNPHMQLSEGSAWHPPPLQLNIFLDLVCFCNFFGFWPPENNSWPSTQHYRKIIGRVLPFPERWLRSAYWPGAMVILIKLQPLVKDSSWAWFKFIFPLSNFPRTIIKYRNHLSSPNLPLSNTCQLGARGEQGWLG